MLGDAYGPQAYLTQVGMGEVLAESGTDTLAANQANDAVAKVFRTQAHDLLVAQQADLRAANDLKLAIQAAVARQQAFVKLTQGNRNKLAGDLAAAQAKASSLKGGRPGRRGGPGRGGGRASRQGRRRGRGSPAGSTQVPSWAWGCAAPRPPRATSRLTGR